MARWYTFDSTDPTRRRWFFHLTGEDIKKYQKEMEYHDLVMFETFVIRNWEDTFWAWFRNLP